MKKKLLMGVLAFCFMFIGMYAVKADGPERSYPVYGNGNTVMWDNTNHYYCGGDYVYANCKAYTVSDDDGEEDEYITLTSGTEVINLNKIALSGGYVVITSQELSQDDYMLAGEVDGIGDGDPADVPGFKCVWYYDKFDDASEYLESANFSASLGDYATVVSTYLGELYSTTPTLTINKNVTVITQYVNVLNLVNNGKIKTSTLSAAKVSGNGNINLVYNAWPQGDPFIPADRLSVNSISGVTVDVTKATVKEGMHFGFIGYASEMTKEEAQKVVDQLNSVKGSSLNGYKVVLKETTLLAEDPNTAGSGTENDKFYIGVLEKNSLSENISDAVAQAKKAVKNPKTGDPVYTIIGLMVLAGAGFTVSMKKAKQR